LIARPAVAAVLAVAAMLVAGGDRAQAAGDPLFPVLNYVIQDGPSTYTLCIGVTNLSTSAITQPAINLFSPNLPDVPSTFAPGFTPCALALLAMYPTCVGVATGTNCVSLGGTMTWVLGQTDFPLTVDYSASGFGGVPVIPGELMTGSGPPSASQGAPGNLYLDTQSDTLYGPATMSNGQISWGSATSLVGPAGPQGVQGPQGPAGVTGPAGSQGSTGPQGTQGPQGPAGATGPAGSQGPAGTPGAAGPQGPPGPQGSAGISILHGSSPPAPSTGVPGDFYLDVTTKAMYGPARGAASGAVAWGQPFQLVGPPGPAPRQGVTSDLSGRRAPAGGTGTSSDLPLQLGLSALVAALASLLTLGVSSRRRRLPS
jgi:hypothetical protein